MELQLMLVINQRKHPIQTSSNKMKNGISQLCISHQKMREFID